MVDMCLIKLLHARVAKPRGATGRRAPRKICVKTPRRRVEKIKIFKQIIINVSKFLIRTS